MSEQGPGPKLSPTSVEWLDRQGIEGLPEDVAAEVLEDRRLWARAAREDASDFCEFVLRDEKTGRPIEQQDLHRAWHRALDDSARAVIHSSVETGKALAVDTPIPTPSGWVPLAEIQRGFLVFDSRGLVCRVKFATPVVLLRDVFEVSFDDGSSLLADGDHRWLILEPPKRKGAEPRTIIRTTSEMLRLGATRPCGAKRRDGTRYETHNWRVPLAGAVNYPEVALPIHPYVLGVWLGDGASAAPRLTCAVEDRFIYDRCVALEGGDCPPQIKNGILTGNVGGFSDKKRNHDPRRLRHRLRLLGVLNNKHVPELYLRASVAQREELLAGLLDTDGSPATKGHGPIEYCSMLPALARDVLELVRSLGFKATMRPSNALLNGRIVGTRWRVCFTAHRSVFRLPRKVARHRPSPFLGRTSYKCVTGIVPVASVPVRCIAVDSPDRTYLAGRAYSVTHNTAQLSVGRMLWELGRDSSLRGAIAANTYTQSVKIVRAIATYIEKSAELHEVFPELLKGEPWSANAITVRRKITSKDPSLQSVGVHGAILGARIDRLAMDDILDFENTGSARMRLDLWDWFYATLLGRLTEHARAWCVGTAFHPDDLLFKLVRPPSIWTHHLFPILDARGASSWLGRWSTERIAAKRVELGEMEFARQMMCRARSDEEARFKQEWIDRCLARGAGIPMVSKIDIMPQGAATFTGVDIGVRTHEGSDLTVLFTLLLWPSLDRQVLWIESGRWSGPEIVRRVVEAHRRYGSIIYVENAAAQEFIVQFAREHGNIPVRGFVTGRNKAHPEFGVEGLAVELQNAQWAIPSINGAPASQEVAAWIDELLFYDPREHTGDRLMASWFAREGARRFSRSKQGGVGMRVLG